MRDHPLALGFTIWAALALYTYVRGMWWRFRKRKRLGWARAYILTLENPTMKNNAFAWEARRSAFAIARLLGSIGWPYCAAFAMWWRFVKVYRFMRLWRRK